MTKAIASLSEHGWITDSKKMLNQLISYYILTDSGQSLAYQNNLINLPKTYYEYINDPDGMASAVKRDLDNLLSRYFQIVDVQTDIRDMGDGRFAILIYAAVVDDGNVRTELSKITQINTTGLRQILEVNNYGDGKNVLINLS